MNTPRNVAKFVLRAAPGEGKPVPLALAGMPTEIEGRKVFYRRKELAKVGSFVHRGTGRTENITKARMLQWVSAFKRRVAKGIKPFVPDRHTLDPRATENFGYVVGLSVEGDSLYADLQLIGDEALALAARNDVSLCAVADALDADGERYTECLHHVALTPNPALSNLGGYVKIAASAGGSPVDVPVFSPAAAPFKRSNAMLQPEQMNKLRQKLNLAAEVPDEQVMDVAAEHVVAAIEVQDQARADAAKVTSLSAELKDLKRELSTATEKVTMLSAGQPKELDPRTLTLMRKTFRTARDEAVASGVISEAGMAKIDKLLGVDKTDGLALSLSAGDGEADDDMLYSRLCEIIAANPGIRTNAAVQRARPGQRLSLSADRETAELSEERKRELLRETPLGQSALAAK